MKTKNQTSLIATLILATILSTIIPATNVFATDDTTVTTTPTETKDQQIDSLASLAELYTRVQNSPKFDDFRERETFLRGMASFAMTLLQPVDEVLNDNDTGEKWYDQLSTATKNAIKDYPVAITLSALKADPLYQSNKHFQAAADWLVFLLGGAITETLPQLLKDYPDNQMLKDLKAAIGDSSDDNTVGQEVSGVSLDLGEYITLATETPNFEVYLNLFITEQKFEVKSSKNGMQNVLNTALMQKVFKPEDLIDMYTEYADLVQEIDPSLLNNLPLYEGASTPNNNSGTTSPSSNTRPQNPIISGNALVSAASVGNDDNSNDDDDNNSNNVSVPNTGIMKWLEDGSIDIGITFIIISATVTALLGIGLIAKLYLRHKIKFSS